MLQQNSEAGKSHTYCTLRTSFLFCLEVQTWIARSATWFFAWVVFSILNLYTYHQPILELTPFYTILHPQKSFFNPQNPTKKIKNDTCKNPANWSFYSGLSWFHSTKRCHLAPCDPNHELRVKAASFKVAVASHWTGQVDPMPVTCLRVIGCWIVPI